jgi:hypothetical protein
MDSASIIRRIHAGRERKVEVEPGKTITLRRPARWDALLQHRGVSVDMVLKCAVAWDGITEADIFGPALAPPDLVPFDAAVFAEVARDRIAWCEALAKAMVEMITEALEQAEATAKN